MVIISFNAIISKSKPLIINFIKKEESKISADENKNVTHKPGLYWVKSVGQLRNKRNITIIV